MKNNIRNILIGLAAVVALGLFIYWWKNKNAIIENKITNAVDKKSDSRYSLKYDSSFIDELNGNASFYNVLLASDTTSYEEQTNNTYKVRIAEVAIKGANVVGLLTGKNLQAKSIHFRDPVFEMKKNQSATLYTREDSLALYERLLGDYKMIASDEISITNGKVILSEKASDKVTLVEDIRIRLTDFKIDSTKDYESLVSYFIKGLDAAVGSVKGTTGSGSAFTISGITFNATDRLLAVKDFRQFKSKMVTNLVNISLTGLQTNVFLRDQKIVADELKTDGGLLTFYRKKGVKRNTFETDSTVFDKAKIRKLNIGKTKLVIINRDKPGDEPLILENLQLAATDIPEVDGSLTDLVAKSNWIIRGDGMKSQSENKMYDMIVGPFVFDKARKTAAIENFYIKPLMSEAAFIKSRKVQEDFFDLQCKNIIIKGVDFEEAFTGPMLRASEVSFQPTIKISNDRTLPRNVTSKLQTDPAALVKNLPIPVAIDKLTIHNGYLSYRERGMISTKTGTIFFDQLNATISNVTNIASAINTQPQMILKANARFMGKPKFETTWQFALNKSNNPFILDGKLGSIDALQLNTVLEPLAMISIRKGQINNFAFHTTGDYSKAHTKGTLLYDDLKLNLLKKEVDERELQRKKALSFLANIFIDDRNPDDGRVRQNEVDFARDSSRSFFYLVSQSFFLSMRKTITGKDNVK